MEYKEALKEVQTKKAKENFMLIELRYDQKLLFPYKDGLAFMAALSHAERLVDDYGKEGRIIGVETQTMRCCVFPASEYEVYKMATLLNVSLDEIRVLANPPKQETT